jgi:hypothetical protein
MPSQLTLFLAGKFFIISSTSISETKSSTILSSQRGMCNKFV